MPDALLGTQTIALIYAMLCVLVIGFQIALILGAPWGRITQGGQVEGSLPLAGRLAAFVSIFILAAMALAALSAAGMSGSLGPVQVPDWPRWSGWAAFGAQCVVAFFNWITPSAPERRLWGPITTLKASCVGYVMVMT
ncbi:hypothetical protein [Thalassovita mediterranea]|jgi:hypothetical protein|uniref:Uncharacterized protein n=1 Tax=Thalassovita mediterranea TaxID=340021 RepID=A0A0P1GS88_9RHOB|nr:hypothetical protein [Thalassovita mediterranea]CUH85649.1 hypothetical protein TM5383_02883 [Thalassovita mediterranea]SIS30020.1 hypothetical protein SAMN05421685_102168 [Thalassovita mediterranea]